MDATLLITLQNYGLSEKEAKVYLTLLELWSAPASSIAKIAFIFIFISDPRGVKNSCFLASKIASIDGEITIKLFLDRFCGASARKKEKFSAVS